MRTKNEHVVANEGRYEDNETKIRDAKTGRIQEDTKIRRTIIQSHSPNVTIRSPTYDNVTQYPMHNTLSMCVLFGSRWLSSVHSTAVPRIPVSFFPINFSKKK